MYQSKYRFHTSISQHQGAHIDVVFKLDAPRAIKSHLLQSLTHHIVRLTFRDLYLLNRGVLVDISLILDVQLAESILKAEDLALLELGVFTLARSVLKAGGGEPGELGTGLPLKLENVHGSRAWGTNGLLASKDSYK